MKLAELKEWVGEQLVIDSDNLDEAAIKTPQIHGEVMNLYSTASLELKDAMRMYDRLWLQRCKYYSGKQTEKYYKQHPLNETILKTDINIYMKGDMILIEAQEIVDEKKMKVEILENALKQVNQRPYLIKDAITFRKFMSGY